MGFSLFKNDNQLYDEAIDLVKRKEYDKAIKDLQKAVEKDKDGNITTKCNALISVLILNNNMNNPGYLTAAAQNLRALGDSDFELGLSTFNAAKLARECDLTADSINVRNMDSSNPEACIQKGQKLMECAQKIQTGIGEDVLMLKEFFANTSITGTKQALLLMAESNESYSSGYAWSDPKKAAEYQQMAYNYRRQLGESGEENLEKVKSYSRSATCWICGRDTTGEGMHFFPMSSDISPQERDGKGILPSTDDSYQSIYVCRACYTAVSRRADAIAKHYHELSMDEIRNTEARLQAEIAALQAQVSSMRMLSNSR